MLPIRGWWISSNRTLLATLKIIVGDHAVKKFLHRSQLSLCNSILHIPYCWPHWAQTDLWSEGNAFVVEESVVLKGKVARAATFKGAAGVKVFQLSSSPPARSEACECIMTDTWVIFYLLFARNYPRYVRHLLLVRTPRKATVVATNWNIFELDRCPFASWPALL